MKKLWVFGDSYGEPYDGELSKFYWSQDYLKWKGYVPKNYSQIMSEELNCQLMNFSFTASNNNQIFQNFCDNIDNIGSDDYVIIQWTEYHRFRLIGDDNQWENFTAHINWARYNLKKITDVSFDTILQLLVNRRHIQYKNEVDSWEKLIKSKINPDNLLIWNPFDVVGKGKFVKSLEKIKDETNNEIQDNHFSENGNKQLSVILLTKLLGQNRNII